MNTPRNGAGRTRNSPSFLRNLILGLLAVAAAIIGAFGAASYQSHKLEIAGSGQGAIVDGDHNVTQIGGANSRQTNVTVDKMPDLRTESEKEADVDNENALGRDAHLRSDLVEARAHFENALAEAKIPYAGTTRLYEKGYSAAENGLGLSAPPDRPDIAENHFRKAAVHALRAGSFERYAKAILNRGNLYKTQRRYTEARMLYAEGLDILKAPFIQVTLNSADAKQLTLLRGYIRNAEFEIDVQEWAQSDSPEHKAHLINEAKVHFLQGQRACDSAGEVLQKGSRLQNYGVFLYIIGDFEGGLAYARKAEAWNRGPNGSKFYLATNLQLVAECASRLNRWQEATKAIVESLPLFRNFGRADMTLMALQTAAKVLGHYGKFENATQALLAIEEIRSRPMNPAEGNDQQERLQLLATYAKKLSRASRASLAKAARVMSWQRLVYFTQAKLEPLSLVAFR